MQQLRRRSPVGRGASPARQARFWACPSPPAGRTAGPASGRMRPVPSSRSVVSRSASVQRVHSRPARSLPSKPQREQSKVWEKPAQVVQIACPVAGAESGEGTFGAAARTGAPCADGAVRAGPADVSVRPGAAPCACGDRSGSTRLCTSVRTARRWRKCGSCVGQDPGGAGPELRDVRGRGWAGRRWRSCGRRRSRRWWRPGRPGCRSGCRRARPGPAATAVPGCRRPGGGPGRRTGRCRVRAAAGPARWR